MKKSWLREMREFPPFAPFSPAVPGTPNTLQRIDGKPLAYHLWLGSNWLNDHIQVVPIAILRPFWNTSCSGTSQRFSVCFSCSPFSNFLGWIKVFVMIKSLNMMLGKILIYWMTKSDCKQLSRCRVTGSPIE